MNSPHDPNPHVPLLQTLLLHGVVESKYSAEVLQTYLARSYPFVGDVWDETLWIPYEAIDDRHFAVRTWVRAGINFLTHASADICSIEPARWFMNFEAKVRPVTAHVPTLQLAERLEMALSPYSEYRIE